MPSALESRFDIREEIGRGAFGQVVRAIDRTTGETVAIKRMLESGDDPSGEERFRLEARLLATVKSPHVVRYVGDGVDENGKLWLALEWLAGRDLAQRSRAQPLAAIDALEAVRQAALGLSALHDAGIVHRDVKPSNFFLLDDASGAIRLKIIDLGIARTEGGAVLTLAGFRIGTPAYMSPEQARGDDSITPVSDLFSLGAVLFELLSGQRAFRAKDVFAIIAKIVLQDPPRLADVVPRVDPALDWIVSRAMAKPVEERFRSARAMAKALEDVMSRLSATIAPRAVEQGEDASTEVVPTAPVPTHEIGALPERRVVTMTFAAFGGSASPDDDRARFGRIVEAHGGVSHPMIGARAVAVFGMTRSTGEEVERAARAALASVRDVPGIRLSISTSVVLASVTGLPSEAIERGAEQLGAVPDRVRIDAVTARLLVARYAIARNDAGETYLGSERALEDTDAEFAGVTTPTIGRDREVAQLRATWSQCIDERVSRAVLLTAPAGAGKSRVADEFVRAIAREHAGRASVVWRTRGDPLGANSPFAIAGALIRRLASVQDGAGLVTARERIRERVARSVPERDRARVTEFIGEIAGIPFPDEASVELRTARREPAIMGDQMRRAFEDFVSAECAMHPVLLVADDLQWGDVPSTRLLDGVLRNLPDAPIMILALARPDVHEKLPRLWADRAVAEIRLAELTRAASERLAFHVLGEKTHPALVNRIVERAAGNAFFLEELIRAIRARRESGSGPDDASLPPTVLALVQARLDALESDTRRVVRAASVFGRTVWQGGLQSLVRSDDDQIVRALSELVQRDVLAPRQPSRLAGETEFAFRQPILRDAAYETLTAGDRAAMHARVGEWLAARGESDALVLAEHFERGGDRPRAARFYRRAAEQALEGNDFASVIARAECAIGCLDDVHGETIGALRLLEAEAHKWRGEYPAFEQRAIEAVRDLAAGSSLWCRAAGELAGAHAALAHGAELSAIAGEIERTDPLADAHAAYTIASSRVVVALYASQQHSRADALLARCERFAAPLFDRDPALAARVLRARASAALADGETERYLAALERAAQFDEQSGNLRAACVERSDTGFALTEIGAHERAVGSLRTALAMAERLGLPIIVGLARHNLGLALFRLGALDEAAREEEVSAASFATLGIARLESVARQYLAQIECARGGVARAASEAERALALAEKTPPIRMRALATVAVVRLREGRVTESIATAREAMTLLESFGGSGEGEAFVRATFIDAADAAGLHTEVAEAHRIAAERVATRAARIVDEKLRKTFVERVAEHVKVARR